MNDSPLEQFLTDHCTPSVKRLLTNALASPSSSRSLFEFRRIVILIEIDGSSVLIMDLLDTSEAGEQRVSTQVFLQALSRYHLKPTSLPQSVPRLP